VFLLLSLFAFSWLYLRSSPRNESFRFFKWFLVFLGLFSAFGVMARVTEHYRLLFYFPFRLFPVLVPLFFFFSLMSACRHRALIRPAGGLLLAVGILALVSLPNGVGLLIDEAKRHYGYWTQYYDWDDLQKNFIWVSENTPRHSIVILPPWRKESFYLTKRATVAHWPSPRMDRFQEWQERIKALVGDFTNEEQHLRETWEEHYNNLSENEIAAIVAKYGGEYLISEAEYDYPILFETETYKVYSLPRIERRTAAANAPISALRR
jgi:hypothetical protein